MTINNIVLIEYNLVIMSDIIKTIRGYTISILIGSGSYGKVYLAIKEGKAYAIKIISRCYSEDPLDDFGIKFDIMLELAGLRHTGIIRDFFFIEEKFYLVMSYGVTNLSLILHNLQTFQIKSISTDVVKQMVKIHNAGILHYDIKPSNIIIMEDDRAVLIDYGIGTIKYPSRFNQNESTNKYTLNYRPPEQFFNAQTYYSKSDVWAFGCTLWEMYIGAAVFTGSDEKEVCHKIQSLLGTYSLKVDKYAIKDVKEGLPAIPIDEWPDMPNDPQLQDLLSNIFVYDIDKRYDINKVAAHPYFAGAIDVSTIISWNTWLAQHDYTLKELNYNWIERTRAIDIAYYYCMCKSYDLDVEYPHMQMSSAIRYLDIYIFATKNPEIDYYEHMLCCLSLSFSVFDTYGLNLYRTDNMAKFINKDIKAKDIKCPGYDQKRYRQLLRNILKVIYPYLTCTTWYDFLCQHYDNKELIKISTIATVLSTSYDFSRGSQLELARTAIRMFNGEKIDSKRLKTVATNMVHIEPKFKQWWNCDIQCKLF